MNNEPKFVATIDVSTLPPGQSTTVTIDGREIAVFNVDGQVYATDDSCPHAGSSLGWGRLDGDVVTCRSHGLRFDVTTGKMIASDAWGIETFPAKIEDGKIWIATHIA
jgi:3-phenylpropionate/trans-cinnamate dioxygenase ferredoxin subunit